MQVSVRQLKNDLSEYLRRVQQGTRVVVTDRNRPVAELSAIPDHRLRPHEIMARLAERGDIELAHTGSFAKVKPLRRRGRPVADTLLEDRR